MMNEQTLIIEQNGTEYYFTKFSGDLTEESSILASLIYVTNFPNSNLKYIRVYPASEYCTCVYHGITNGETITWRQIPNT